MADERYKQLWEERMIAQYGSVEAGKAKMREFSQLQKGKPKPNSPLKKNPELAKQLGKMGADKRWNKTNEG